MIFLDRSGHTFSLPSYSYEPIGHEFEENDYVFWIDDSSMNKLSINNYYVRTIYLVVPFDKITKVVKENDLTEEQKLSIIKNHPLLKDDKNAQHEYIKYVNDFSLTEDYKFSEVAKITITSNSNKFCLIKTSDIQDLVNGITNLNDYLKYDLKDNKLVTIDSDNDDLYAVTISSDDEFNASLDNKEIADSIKKYGWSRENVAIVPIYVLGISKDEGTWLSNLLIHVENKKDANNISYDAVDEDWCSITIGGEFSEENELLYINGKNMGVELPKDMFRAIYQNSFINDEFNEELYNEKLKEYLINFMQIKGECGNYNSVISSLKWFGYGDKLTISKLLRTDNEFKYQYIRDYFNINTDVLKSFSAFKNSTYIALTLSENTETGKYNDYDIKKTVYGEGTPELEDNFSKIVETEYDYNNEKFKYLKPYYDFTFYEMGLKIACLKYYYKKYFLPLHLKIHSATIAHKVYANDVKFNNNVYKTILSEHPILLGNLNKNKKVLFEKSQVKYFVQSKRVVDENFNEFYSYKENDSKDMYMIDDTCLSIPIKFVNDYDESTKTEKPTYFNCVLLLEKEFYIKDTKNPYRMEFNVPINVFKDDFYVYNKDTKQKEDLNNFQFSYSIQNNNKEWSQWINGINEVRQYLLETCTIELYSRDYDTNPELSFIENEKLKKTNKEIQIEVYSDTINNSVQQICYALNCDNIFIDSKSLTELLDGRPELEKFTKIVETHTNGSVLETTEETYNGIRILDFAQEIITNNYYLRIPSTNDLRKNPINTYDITTDIIYVPKLYLKMKYDQTEIYDFRINTISYKNNVKINFVKETSLIYESHFNFVQNPNDLNTMYHSFVIYPKIMNNKDINFFINQEFKLKLLVNDEWYEYKFVSKMTDIDIEFGKLVYKYWSNDNKYISRFRQLSDDSVLDPDNLNNTKIRFNSYMFEPRLVEVNDINYWHHLENYVEKYNIMSLDNVKNFNCQYINYNGIKIFFNLDTIKSYDKENDFVFSVTNREIEQAFDKDRLDPTILVINKTTNFAKKHTLDYKRGWTNTPIIDFERLYRNSSDKEVMFYYDKLQNVIYANNQNDVEKYQIHEYSEYLNTFVQSSTDYFKNFITSLNLPQNRKYLNNIQLYDIYEKKIISRNLFSWTKYTNLCCNGVLFYHTNVNKSTDAVIEYKKDGIDIEDTLTLQNAIRISGTPLWDDDVYSNDVDLYSNYFNYDITTNDENIYDADENKYNMKALIEYYDKTHTHPITEANNLINSEYVINNYHYFIYEDFTGKRYYTVENLNDTISHIQKNYNLQNISSHIQISDLFGLYSAYNVKSIENILYSPLIPRAEQYDKSIALIYDSLFFTKNLNDWDKYLDEYHNSKLDFGSITHVCDIYVKSLVELSNQNTTDIDFTKDNVVWDINNNFSSESTTIKRIINKTNNLAYFIMKDYKRFIYRLNDVKENIDNDIHKLFSTEIIEGEKGLPLYYKLSYAKYDKASNTYRVIDKSSLSESDIREIALGNECKDIRICIHLYYDMSSLTFISDRYGKEVLIPCIINEDTVLTEDNVRLNNVTTYMQDSWVEKLNKYGISKEGNYGLTASEYHLQDYFKYVKITDNVVKTFINENGEETTKNDPIVFNILANNVFDTIYINEHNNEVVPNQQPGQYVYNISIDNSYDDITKTLEELNVNSKENGYEKGIINLSQNDNEHITTDKAKELLKEYYTSEYARESLRNAYESNINGEQLERIDDYDYSIYENVYTIKTLTHESGNLLLDFELYFNPNYYNNLKDENGNALSNNDFEQDTYKATFKDQYHKDKYGNVKVWNYEYYSPKYLKENTSIIYVINRDGDKTKVESGEITYDANRFDASKKVINVNYNDVLYLYIKIKTNIDDERFKKYGVESRIRIPEFYIIPLIYKYIENMSKLKYKKSKVDDLNSYNLYEILLHNNKMSSNDYINFEEAFKQQNNKIYTEFFENTYLIRDENQSMYTMHNNSNGDEIVTKEMYDIERLYDLEKQYNVWSQTNKLIETDVLDSLSICVTDGEHADVYYAINTSSTTSYTNLNELSTLEKNNLINFAKYDYSIKQDGDFYACKTYYNNSEVNANEYVYDKKYTKFISPKVNINMFLDYDMYLMHDDNYWYTIFISQDTINKAETDLKLNVSDEQKTLLSYNSVNLSDDEKKQISLNGNKVENDFYYNYTPYELRYVRSNNDFLINRMKFISSEGVNQFNADDIIVGNITNNHRLPINIIHSSKWKISPLSYGMNFTSDTKSNTEMCILSYPKKKDSIERGYYDVSIRYSLDRNVSHQYTKKAKLKVK